MDFRPHSARSELFRWYCVSDVVAVPSYNESFGLVALEAQACGRPVVATDVGGLRHTVRRSLQRPAGQAVTISANGLTRLARSLMIADEMIRMGINAASHASTFSWDNTAAATLQRLPQSPRPAELRSEPRGPHDKARLRQRSGAWRCPPAAGLSALTPKIAWTTPPMIISAAPMK